MLFRSPPVATVHSCLKHFCLSPPSCLTLLIRQACTDGARSNNEVKRLERQKPGYVPSRTCPGSAIKGVGIVNVKCQHYSYTSVIGTVPTSCPTPGAQVATCKIDARTRVPIVRADVRGIDSSSYGLLVIVLGGVISLSCTILRRRQGGSATSHGERHQGIPIPYYGATSRIGAEVTVC